MRMLQAGQTGKPERLFDEQGRHVPGSLGGHVGRFAPVARTSFWVVAAATVAWLVCVARQLPCQRGDVNEQPRNFDLMCYSDVDLLYLLRQLDRGNSPYNLEYPVLTNVFVHLTRKLAWLVGAPHAGTLTTPQLMRGGNIFMAVTMVSLFVCFLVAVLAQMNAVRTRPLDALYVAAAPTLMVAGLINWDLLTVMLAALAVWAWSRGRPTWCGVFIGLGVAAKLYPFLLLIPLFPLCLRTGKIKEYLRTLGGAVVAWGIPNAVAYFANPQAWLVFWTFNAKRPADLGSIYLALIQFHLPVPNVSLLQSGLMVLGAAAVVALGLWAPRRPRLGQLAFLMVVWFLMVNKVYSPQYVVWLLPFVVLARPRWQTYVVWTLAELTYFAALWHWFTLLMTPGSADFTRFYACAIVTRVAVQAALAGLVVWEILRPARDIVRRDGVDDPSGGVLDGTPDAAWLPWRRKRNSRRPEPVAGGWMAVT